MYTLKELAITRIALLQLRIERLTESLHVHLEFDYEDGKIKQKKLDEIKEINVHKERNRIIC